MEDNSVASYLPIIILTTVIGAFVTLYYYVSGVLKKTAPENQHHQESDVEDEVSVKNGPVAGKSKQRNQERWQRHQKEKKVAFSDDWLITNLKAHTARVLGIDFSNDGKYLASCGEDRAIYVWPVKEFPNNDHKWVRASVNLDHSDHIGWGLDLQSLIVHNVGGNNISVYDVKLKNDSSVAKATHFKDFEEACSGDIISMGVACTGKYIMTCSEQNQLALWDFEGNEIASVDTCLGTTYFAAISPCARFVAACGFSSDVKVWEVVHNRSGEFDRISKAFDLVGHKASVLAASFNGDSSLTVTVSRDGTWRLHDTKVEYQKQQDPHLLLSVKYATDFRIEKPGQCHIVISPDGHSVALAVGTTVQIFSAKKGLLEREISNVHAELISQITFDPLSRFLVTSGDHHIHVFYNVVGFRSQLRELEERKQSLPSSASSAMRDRLDQQIKEAKKILKKAGDVT